MTVSVTTQRLRDLGLSGMADALTRQSNGTLFMEMGFEARLASLIDAEVDGRERRRLDRILKSAHLRFRAMPEAIDYRADRGLNRDLLLDILTLTWLDKNRNGIIEGACGAGKTFIACAIGMQAARNGISVQYHRLHLLLERLEEAHNTGGLAKLRRSLATPKLLILDDFGLVPMSAMNRHDLFELIEARTARASTLIIGQLPVEHWHGFIEDPPLADAILDRIVHTAFRLEVKGESMRKLSQD